MVPKNLLLAAIIFRGTIFALPNALEENITGTEQVCEQVDFETLLEQRIAGENLDIVPGGFYAKTPSGCFFTSIDEPTMQQKHLGHFKVWHLAMKHIDDELAQSELMGLRSTCPMPVATSDAGGI